MIPLSSETEWEALLVAVKRMMFIVQLLQSMNISVELHIMVKFDDLGAIFMVGNAAATSHTKHMDVR